MEHGRIWLILQRPAQPCNSQPEGLDSSYVPVQSQHLSAGPHLYQRAPQASCKLDTHCTPAPTSRGVSWLQSARLEEQPVCHACFPQPLPPIVWLDPCEQLHLPSPPA